MVKIIHTLQELRKALAQDMPPHCQKIGFVPTMGALHAGHGALMQHARKDNEVVVVSIFVNPKQFAPHEDLDQYPRPIENDIAFLEAHHVDYLFLPDVSEIYPDEFSTKVIINGSVTQGLESEFRPHFFDGVTTIVAKLFMAVMPHTAYFGEKDYQQLCVIQQMVKDLAMPIIIQGVPTIRDSDGLALSSRNQYLSKAELQTAKQLNKIMFWIANQMTSNVQISDILSSAKQKILTEGFTRIDYLTLKDAQNLADIQHIDPLRSMRLLVAAYIGHVRLIDNISITVN